MSTKSHQCYYVAKSVFVWSFLILLWTHIISTHVFFYAFNLLQMHMQRYFTSYSRDWSIDNTAINPDDDGFEMISYTGIFPWGKGSGYFAGSCVNRLLFQRSVPPGPEKSPHL